MDKIILKSTILDIIEKLQKILEDISEIDDKDSNLDRANDIEYIVCERLKNIIKLIELEVFYLKKKENK